MHFCIVCVCVCVCIYYVYVFEGYLLHISALHFKNLNHLLSMTWAFKCLLLLGLDFSLFVMFIYLISHLIALIFLLNFAICFYIYICKYIIYYIVKSAYSLHRYCSSQQTCFVSQATTFANHMYVCVCAVSVAAPSFVDLNMRSREVGWSV